MFTVEIRINGTLINHIYGRNMGSTQDGYGPDKYSYEMYMPESRGVKRGEVLHEREDGIQKLVRLILEDAE